MIQELVFRIEYELWPFKIKRASRIHYRQTNKPRICELSTNCSWPTIESLSVHFSNCNVMITVFKSVQDSRRCRLNGRIFFENFQVCKIDCLCFAVARLCFLWTLNWAVCLIKRPTELIYFKRKTLLLLFTFAK